MTPHQQDITVLVAGLFLSIAAIGLVIMLSALAFPALSTTGRRLFATGIIVAVSSSLAYLTYVVTAAFILSEGRP